MEEKELTLEAGDAQDLADVVCGLTAIGGYCSSAGLDSDAERIEILRRRIIKENEGIALDLVHGDIVTSGVDPTSFTEGVRDILDGNE